MNKMCLTVPATWLAPLTKNNYRCYYCLQFQNNIPVSNKQAEKN